MINISCKKQPRLPIVEVAFYFVNKIKYLESVKNNSLDFSRKNRLKRYTS